MLCEPKHPFGVIPWLRAVEKVNQVANIAIFFIFNSNRSKNQKIILSIRLKFCTIVIINI
ncbi:MAG TPA: hypothetical protein LFV92_00990 [Rickettsia endosymbiont of Ceroptres masudai]|nr:hypothetical protein [Rickettsia endosymbiont of Ceroptres masudai]